ncbi:MAG: hypothetical protein Q4P18_00980 [Methanobrevibacter sp.]|uniref:hypothetical protein n=1 Tax=Methanobrevibacter sp. TaxID=66852 RepID=UPI0026DED4E3|nr:hypothetical protein [Methanobrevibacter sp.]MDO5848087.1 hypothetical protein [Methanobrevibacter sp.]
MVVIATTKVYLNKQTAIPRQIIETLEIGENDVIEWDLDKDNNVKLNFRKREKEWTFDDIVGLMKTKEKTNAVELEMEPYQ